MRRTATASPLLAAAFCLAALAALAAGCGGSAVEPIPSATVPADRGALTTRFVTDFMAARARGDEAAAGLFLSPTAAEQIASGAGGLTLAGGGAGFAGWALLAVEAADASSHEVRVRVEPHDGAAWEELLFVGVGPGPDGESRDLTVRGVERLPAPG
jgi:hypothetical protein